MNDRLRVIRVHDMEVNLIKRSVTLGGKDIKLTAKEFALLMLFVSNRGIVLSRDRILNEVWGYDSFGVDRTVDWQIKLELLNLLKTEKNIY